MTHGLGMWKESVDLLEASWDIPGNVEWEEGMSRMTHGRMRGLRML